MMRDSADVLRPEGGMLPLLMREMMVDFIERTLDWVPNSPVWWWQLAQVFAKNDWP